MRTFSPDFWRADERTIPSKVSTNKIQQCRLARTICASQNGQSRMEIDFNPAELPPAMER
jgi:hypothetical protein